MNVQADVAAGLHIRLRQRLDLLLRRVVEGPRDAGDPMAESRLQSACQRIVIQQDRGGGIATRQLHQWAGAVRRRDFVSRQPRRQPRPLAPLRRPRHPYRHAIALAQASSPFAVGQEPLGPIQRHETSCHRANPGHHPPAKQVANTIRGTGPPDGVIQQRPITHHRDPHLARAAGGQDALAHGNGQPSPRSSCAVSNSGRPTTFE